LVQLVQSHEPVSKLVQLTDFWLTSFTCSWKILQSIGLDSNDLFSENLLPLFSEFFSLKTNIYLTDFLGILKLVFVIFNTIYMYIALLNSGNSFQWGKNLVISDLPIYLWNEELKLSFIKYLK